MPGERVAGILLAAGGSTRFGADKLATRWGDRTLLERSALAMLDAGLDPVLAVVQPGPRSHMSDRVTCVINDRWRTGIASSVQTGLAALVGEKSVCAAVLAPADQPWCGPSVYRQLLDRFRDSVQGDSGEGDSGEGIVVATFNGAMRNPVLLARRRWSLADSIDGDTGLSAVVRTLSPMTVECSSIGSIADIDSHADLNSVRSRPDFGGADKVAE